MADPQIRIRISQVGARGVIRDLNRIRQSARNVQGANQRLAGSSRRATGAINRQSQASRDLSRSFQVLLGPLSGVASRITAFTQISSAGTKTLFGLVIALTAVSFAMVKVFKDAVRLESLKATFSALSDSVAQADASFALIVETSDKLGLTLLTSARSFQLLQAAAQGTQLEGLKIEAVFRNIAAAGATLKLSGEQMSRVFLAVTQILNKSTVSSEELKQQLGEVLPFSMRAAADAAGVTTAELSDLLKEGKLVSEEFLLPFSANLRRMAGDTQAATDTVVSNWNRFTNAIVVAGGAVNETTGLTRIANFVLKEYAETAKLIARIFSDDDPFKQPVLPPTPLEILTKKFIKARSDLSQAVIKELTSDPFADQIVQTEKKIISARKELERLRETLEVAGDRTRPAIERQITRQIASINDLRNEQKRLVIERKAALIQLSDETGKREEILRQLEKELRLQESLDDVFQGEGQIIQILDGARSKSEQLSSVLKEINEDIAKGLDLQSEKLEKLESDLAKVRAALRELDKVPGIGDARLREVAGEPFVTGFGGLDEARVKLLEIEAALQERIRDLLADPTAEAAMARRLQAQKENVRLLEGFLRLVSRHKVEQERQEQAFRDLGTRAVQFAAAELDAFRTERAREAFDLIKDMRTETEVFADRASKLRGMLKSVAEQLPKLANGTLDWAGAVKIVNKAIDESNPALQKLQSTAEEAVDILADGFADVALEGKSFLETINDIDKALVRLGLQAIVFDPLKDFVKEAVTSGSGGGFLGDLLGSLGIDLGLGERAKVPAGEGGLSTSAEQMEQVADDLGFAVNSEFGPASTALGNNAATLGTSGVLLDQGAGSILTSSLGVDRSAITLSTAAQQLTLAAAELIKAAAALGGGGGGGDIGGIFGGGSSTPGRFPDAGGPPIILPTDATIPGFRSGGRVGRSRVGARVVNPNVFANAPRFQMGTDEVPAILHRGERVQNRAQANGLRDEARRQQNNITFVLPPDRSGTRETEQGMAIRAIAAVRAAERDK